MTLLTRSIHVLSALTLVTGLSLAQDKAGTQSQQSDPEMEKMMKMWEQVATPGEPHKRLNTLVGSWTTKSTAWMDPSTPMVSTGTAELKWILGGRFLQQEVSGEMMGMPFSGIGFTGYDNYSMKYSSVWIDNSATAMFTSEGSFDQTGKVLTMYGKMDEWMTGERDKNVKYVTKFDGPDSFTFELHDLSLGENGTKTFEMAYTRKK